jgi:hypothetical protein
LASGGLRLNIRRNPHTPLLRAGARHRGASLLVGAVAGFVAELEHWLTQACTDMQLSIFAMMDSVTMRSYAVRCGKSRPVAGNAAGRGAYDG